MVLPRRLVVATKNADKAREVRAVLAAAAPKVEVVEGPDWPDVAETGATLEENALLKARAVAAATGLPAVADPGAALVASAHRQGIAVVPLAGPSSLLMALAASGLNGQSFAFVGYLPTDAAARAARLQALQQQSRRERQTQIAIETPYRNAALMTALLEALPADTQLSVACGLTLPGGWCATRTVAQWRAQPPAFNNKHLPAVFLWLAG